MFKIALNAGHGLNTAGKRCLKTIDPNETREWYLNSRICNKIEAKLKDYDGYSLIRLDDTTGKTDVALKTRTDKANAFKADVYLSIHHNAGVNGRIGGGIVAFVYTSIKDGSETAELQKAFYNAVVKHTGLKGNRAVPLAKKDLHEVRESKMPAVLLECGFMDSTTDTPIILTDKFAEEVATGCVEVLVAKGNLKKKVTSTPQTAAPTKPATATTATPTKPVHINIPYFPKYTGTSSSIVDGLKAVKADSKFAYRSKIAKKNNISLYVGTAAQNKKMLTLLKQGKLIKP